MKDDKKPSGPKPLTRREVAEIAPDLKAEYAVCVKEYDLPRFKRLLGKYAPDKDRETKDKLIEEFIALAEAYRAARRAR